MPSGFLLFGKEASLNFAAKKWNNIFYLHLINLNYITTLADEIWFSTVPQSLKVTFLFIVAEHADWVH